MSQPSESPTQSLPATADEPGLVNPVLRSYRRASWPRRALAWFLDAVVTAIPVSIVVTLAGIGSREVITVVHGKPISSHTAATLQQQAIEAGLWIAAQVIYYAFMERGSRGQTLGKRWTGIATVDLATGGPIGAWRAGLRALIAGGLLCCLLVPGLVNAFWPLFDPGRRALHDHATGTVVIEVVG